MDQAQMIRLVRRTVADPDGTLFTDQDVTDALAMYGQDTDQHAVKLAAADLLDMVAVSEALVSKKITTQDLSVDGVALSAELRQHAARLRGEVQRDRETEGEAFYVVVPGRQRRHHEGEEVHW